MPPKLFNERPGNNKWYNEKRNTRRSEEPPRSKTDYNYRESSRNRDRGTDNINGKQRSENVHEREVTSADRESNSSVENSNSRRRPKARNHNNQSQSGKKNIFEWF